ncbi:MAG: M20 aminoacylase family protein [Candidatus Puniceispirillaceae bacterium]
MAILNSIAQSHDEMTAWRHALHQHPEICYEEFWTSDFIAAQLQEFGIEVHRGMGKTGVVGILKGQGDSTAAIGLRADMDGLPMTEANMFSHKSLNEGRMHACGHDGHMAMLLGAAKYLSQTRQFDGTVYFIFQPAEEGGAGAKAMIGDGLFSTFDVDHVWGMHNWPGLDVGKVAVHDGACMASADHFKIVLHGRGGHAAMPQQSCDPIIAGAALVQSLQSIVSRATDPLDAAVVSVTCLQGGSAYNVIPDTLELRGTARALLPKTRAAIQDQIRKITDNVSAAYSVSAEIDWRVGYPPTMNHKAEAQRAVSVASDVVGEANIVHNPPASMGAEDFAYMLEERKGAYIWLGSGEAVAGKMLHNTSYDFNDEILPIGASYWARLVETELKAAR